MSTPVTSDSSPASDNPASHLTSPAADWRRHLNFRPSQRNAIGVEWEVALVDPETGDLVSRAPEILEELASSHPQLHFEREFLQNSVEMVTGICPNAAAAVAELSQCVAALQQAAARRGLALWAAGGHPFAAWQDQPLSEKQTYSEIIERTQYWGKQMLIWGLHTHIGIRATEYVWPVINALMVQAPVLLALSANSPAYQGIDTGYCSNRTMLYQQLPTAGIPYTFNSWEEYCAYLTDQHRSGVINHTGTMHFDIRPAAQLGTIEIRVCDSPADLKTLGALVALMHCLAVHYERRAAAGQPLPSLPHWHNAENKWRAARYGMEAWIITDRETNERTVREVLAELVPQLLPLAAELGCETELAYIAELATHTPAYARQRAAVAAATPQPGQHSWQAAVKLQQLPAL